jgi:hypothetical protein
MTASPHRNPCCIRHLGSANHSATSRAGWQDGKVHSRETTQAIVLPDLGALPVVLSLWFADPGDEVFEGDRLVEVRVGGATFDVPAPATGRLAERHALPDDPLQPGQVLGLVEVAEPAP